MDQFLDSSRKSRLYTSIIALIILLALFIGVKFIAGVKEISYIGRGTYPTNVVTVTGKGEVVAIPDTGSFSFSVVETAKTVPEAQAQATKKINAIIDALKSAGVAEKDIKTTNYSSYPQYDYVQSTVCRDGYCPGGKQVLRGYEVNQSVTVKVRKLDTAGSLLTKVGDLGASNISSLEFVVDDIEGVKAEARDKAITDAKEKAKILGKSLGVKLTKIVNFTDTGEQPPMYYAMDSKVMGAGTMMGNQEATPSIPVGENKITSTVMITYEVDQ